jgi:hypothetical protein
MKHIIFGLYDVLIKGNQYKDMQLEYLNDLKTFCKENNIKMYLVTGLRKEIGESIIKEHNLLDYFEESNIAYIDDSYLNSLSPEDKELKEKKFKENPNSEDDYHKIHFLKQNKLDIDDSLVVGHDIWTDAFYIRRYTKANVILIKETISNNHKPFIEEIKKLHVITPDYELFKKYLIETPEFDYSYLNSYATKALQRSLIGAIDFGKLDMASIIKKKQEQELLKKLKDEKKDDTYAEK